MRPVSRPAAAASSSRNGSSTAMTNRPRANSSWQPTRARLRRLDQTVIPVVKVLDDGAWWVRDIHIGRWGPKETAKRIVDILADETVKSRAFGMDKGSLFNAVMPYIIDEANSKDRKTSVYVNARPLTHENRAKIDRITWALAGRFEHGRIS